MCLWGVWGGWGGWGQVRSHADEAKLREVSVQGSRRRRAINPLVLAGDKSAVAACEPGSSMQQTRLAFLLRPAPGAEHLFTPVPSASSAAINTLAAFLQWPSQGSAENNRCRTRASGWCRALLRARGRFTAG